MYTQHLERIPAGDGLVQLRGPCFVTGKVHTSPPVTEVGLKRYEAGALAQVCFPELSPEEREFLISGTSPEGWRRLYPAETDEPPTIYAYTRAQALADGVLIDASETAKEAGLRLPVALTAAVWGEYVKVPDGVSGQDERGRLWDICWMLSVAIRRSTGEGSELLFHLAVRNDNRDGEPPLVTLKAVCGPGDNHEPVITVMRTDED